jgi:hypothetical protein
MSRNIYIRIKGGLGNQIFQYAFALRLELNGFHVNGFLINSGKDGFGRIYLLDAVLKSAPNIVSEVPAETVLLQSESDTTIIDFLEKNLTTSVLLDGYFQNINYLQHINLENYFKTPEPKLFHQTAAVHVRRNNFGHHGILPFSYYTKALSLLGHPQFIVYSDEVKFAEYMFSSIQGYSGIIHPNLDNPCEDFLQLTGHSSIVIANSSFSWLAAFLAFKKSKAKIIYPSEWTLMNIDPGYDPTWVSVSTNLIRP